MYHDRKSWLLTLPPMFAAGAALFTWSVAGALNHHGMTRDLLSLAVGVGLLIIWLLESGLLGRLLHLPLSEAAARIAISWIPLFVLPASAPYFSLKVASSFLRDDPSAGRILALAFWLAGLAVAGSIALKILLFWRRSEAVLAYLDRRAGRIVCVGTAVYFVVFTSLAFLAYHWFLGYHSDLGQYNQTMWASLRGHIFYSVGLEETSGSYLSTHVSPFLLIVITPLYAIWQSPLMYLLLRTLGLSLAAIPLFYLVRHLTRSGAAAILLVAAFFFHPEIVSQNFNSGYENIFVAAPFLAAFYFFLNRRFGWFFLFLVIVVMVREDFIPAAFVFALYALVQRRPAKWILAPLTLGVVWGVAVLLIFDATIEHFIFNEYYGHFGSTPSSAIRTVLTHPIYALQEIKRIHSSYLYNLLLPEGFILPWTSFSSIFALPNIGISVMRSTDTSGVAGGIAHYSVLVVSAFWVGIASFINRVQKRLPGKEQATAVFVSVFIVVMVASCVHIWAYFLPVSPSPDAPALSKAIALVPEDPEVSFSSNDGRALSHLSSRWKIFEPLLWDVPQPPDYLPQGIDQLPADYVLVKPFRNPYYNDAGAFAFLTEPGNPYKLIFQEGDIRLYKKD